MLSISVKLAWLTHSFFWRSKTGLFHICSCKRWDCGMWIHTCKKTLSNQNKRIFKNDPSPAGQFRQQMLSCSYSMPSLQETSRLDLILMDPWARARSNWLLAACMTFNKNKIYTQKKHLKNMQHIVSIKTGFLVNNLTPGSYTDTIGVQPEFREMLGYFLN